MQNVGKFLNSSKLINDHKRYFLNKPFSNHQAPAGFFFVFFFQFCDVKHLNNFPPKISKIRRTQNINEKKSKTFPLFWSKKWKKIAGYHFFLLIQ